MSPKWEWNATAKTPRLYVLKTDCSFCVLIAQLGSELTRADADKYEVHLRIAHGWIKGALPEA